MKSVPTAPQHPQLEPGPLKLSLFSSGMSSAIHSIPRSPKPDLLHSLIGLLPQPPQVLEFEDPWPKAQGQAPGWQAYGGQSQLPPCFVSRLTKDFDMAAALF